MTRSDFLDQPPDDVVITAYDEAHFKIYLRLLDAETQGASWQEVVQVLFGLNAEEEPQRAVAIYSTHLARAHWIRDKGFDQLLDRRPH